MTIAEQDAVDVQNNKWSLLCSQSKGGVPFEMV
jgi:hypothetical protein